MDRRVTARLGASQNLASTGTSSATAAFGAQTLYVRVLATAAVQVRISDGTPTAVTTDTALAPNIPEYFIVTPGQKLASIGTATVNVTELTG
jgi:hypothetical protein